MYDLHSLGWNSFQQLCLTISREILGQTIESFLDTNDGGRDGAFAGTWKSQGGEQLTGNFVIQCKFTSRANHALIPSDIADELIKVRRLVDRGLCDSYLLMTNAAISGKNAEAVQAVLGGAGAKHTALLGATWLGQQIRESKRLRMLVPRVYGLGDLSQILDERAYVQARAIIESLREDLAKVVVTESYRRAVAALDSHSFVLIIGEPAAGKTTIASMLAMAAADQWNASLLKLDVPATVVERWNPDEPSQFFWIDDAFGASQYEDFLVRGWNHVFPQVKTMLHRGAKIVMTSRDYIYNRARQELKESAFPLLRESQVVIDVHDLLSAEKEQILYNHLKLGRQPKPFRKQVKPFLTDLAAHPRFIPEIARRLAEPIFTQGLQLDAKHLAEFVERRSQLLKEVIGGLDRHSRAALALIYMRSDRLQSPISLQESEEHALERLGSSLGGCITALASLNGSLVQYALAEAEAVWRFKHPTIGDAYAATLVESPELLGIFVQGSPTDKLMAQCTCGEVGIEHAIVIPNSLFDIILHKLAEFARSQRFKAPWRATSDARSIVQGFLTRRCSKDFLSLYLARYPDLLDDISQPGLYLNAVPEVDLAIRLHEFDILPEETRKQFVDTVSRYAVTGEDFYALEDADIRGVFRDREFEGLLMRIRSLLLPKLAAAREELERQSLGNETAEEHMHSLLHGFDALKEHFGGHPDALGLIERQIQLTHEWVAENTVEQAARESRELGNVQTIVQPSGARSIFDDIDD